MMTPREGPRDSDPPLAVLLGNEQQQQIAAVSRLAGTAPLPPVDPTLLVEQASGMIQEALGHAGNDSQQRSAIFSAISRLFGSDL